MSFRPATAVTRTHDNLDRLTSETTATITSTYDSAGNRSLSVPGQTTATYTYGNADRLITTSPRRERRPIRLRQPRGAPVFWRIHRQ